MPTMKLTVDGKFTFTGYGTFAFEDVTTTTKTDAARSPAPSKGMSRTVDFELTEEISSDYYVNSAMHADFLVRG